MLVVKRILRLAAVLLFAWTAAGCGTPDWPGVRNRIRQKFPEVPQVGAAWLAEKLEADGPDSVFLVDVRSPEEYAVSHLQGAVQAEKVSEVQALLDRRTGVEAEKPVVLYCSVGYRSSSIASRLIDKGYENILNLEGSIFQWANEGRPVYRAGRPVHEVHPYNNRWGKLLDRSLHPGKSAR